MEKKRDIKSSVRFIRELDFELFSIPDYQRPYSWEIKNVRQLWDDITKSQSEDKLDYRIGTIILHQNNGALDIVDGQQRITTLCLILLCLGSKTDSTYSYHSFLNKKQYSHSESIKRIRENVHEIQSWISEECTSKQEFKDYLLNHCSFIELKVKRIDEAFQMFDSQNGRGMELEAYNLLKAYHIQAFDPLNNQVIPEEVKIQCDREWEAAAKDSKKDYLRQIINEQLYRGRVWGRRRIAYDFNKRKIKEFKGITKQLIKFPYQNIASLYGDELFSSTPGILRCSYSGINNFIQLNQPIINGKPFFEYIRNYVETYKILFENNQTEELIFFSAFYNTYCNYSTNRVGDKYLKELYKTLVMIVFDMYGVTGLKMYYKTLYAIVYRLRLEKHFVKYDTVAKYPLDIIPEILYSQDLSDLSFLKTRAKRDIVKRAAGSYELIENLFVSELNIKISYP